MPTLSHETDSGWPTTGFGRPKFTSLLGSFCFHAVAISGLLYAHAHPGPPPPLPPKATDSKPTVLKIGDKLYFVAHLPPPTERKLEAPKAAPPKPKAPESKQVRAEEPPPPPPPVEVAREAPRVFVPPKIHRNLVTESTLIQPLTPAEQVPENVPLPSFRIQTPQPKRLTRQFVTPGRPKATPPAPPTPQTIAPPEINTIHADPTALDLQAKLTLPPTPPPVVDTPPPPKPVAVNTPPPAPKGDPVDILSLSDRPVPPSDKLVVPAGNVIGRTGEGTILAPKANTPTPVKPVTPDRPPSPPSTVASVSNLPPAPFPGNGTNPNAPKAAPSLPAAPAAAPAGNGTTPGGTTPTGTGTGRTQPGDTIHRPNNGTFDVVVQSTSVDPFPESRDLLTGRPIYTVYISVGSAKDWALYFCVPGEKPAAATPGGVVQIGPSNKSVQAPYPTTLVRPNVSVPSFYKNVLIYGRVNAAGKFEALRVVKSIKPETDQALIASLAGWEFRPASRDGVSIGVEFLLAIPVAGL